MIPYFENKNLIVVNMFGGPGTGKSTCALEVTQKLKKQHRKVEYVDEHCKRWTRTAQKADMFTEQDLILGIQNNKLRSLVGEVDIAVTDTSLLLGLFYRAPWFPQSFDSFLVETYDSYSNINIFLRRNPDIPFDTEGRNEDAAQSIVIDEKCYEYLVNSNKPFFDLMAGDNAAGNIITIIEQWSPAPRQ